MNILPASLLRSALPVRILSTSLVSLGILSLGILSLGTLSSSLPAQAPAEKPVQAPAPVQTVKTETPVQSADVTPNAQGEVTDPNAPPKPIRTNKDKPIPEGCWFKPIHLDFGEHFEHKVETVRGVYEFVNATGQDQEIRSLLTSCKCQRLKFKVNGKELVIARKGDMSLKAPIAVPAGAKGRIEMDFDISGAAGRRTGDIRLETSDPKMPSMVLTAEALVKPAYEITPARVDLGQMDPSEQREWQVKVRCLVRKDWKILRADKVMPQGMAVTSIEPVEENGEKHYIIKGTYGPGLSDGAFGGYPLFHTDDDKQPVQVMIAAIVKQQVKMAPRFFSFRSFQRSSPPSEQVFIWSADGKSIVVDRVEVTTVRGASKEDVGIELIAPVKDSKEMIEVPHQREKMPANRVWRVRVSMKPNFKGRGAVRGTISVFSKAAKVPLTFKFNGFPRG
jgi:hypothetical protein